MEMVCKLLSELDAIGLGASDGMGNASRTKGLDIVIEDPSIIRSKGAPRGSTNAKLARWCRHCNRVGARQEELCNGIFNGENLSLLLTSKVIEEAAYGERRGSCKRARGS
ncbi:hypothetical protein PIB30_056371 [Stylosanthes scabra]|uniref:Uncharacterized protein n=1 Tax=Stylosanthes scabra TaxID=79078 RepID=A0ABU6SK29_9FABA|nr:hypothetical protein [Stylosanthes scabra]